MALEGPGRRGYANWVALTEAQIQRFSRHILLREVGGRGQLTLLETPVALRSTGPAFDAARVALSASGSPLTDEETTAIQVGSPTAGLQGQRAVTVGAASLVAGCAECGRTLPMEPPSGPAVALLLGYAAALCAHRLVLGLHTGTQRLTWAGERLVTENVRCSHQ